MIEQRLSGLVSCFRGVVDPDTSAKRYILLKEFFKEMLQPPEELHELSSRAADAIARGDLAAYKSIKEGTLDGQEKGFPAIIPGKFTHRRNDACAEYLPLLLFDIDGITDRSVVGLILSDCKRDPHIFAAFPSPGRGIRILVWCDSTLDSHKAYYRAVCRHLSTSLNIPTDKDLRKQWKEEGWGSEKIKVELKQTCHIDTGTNNPGRIWFYSAVDRVDFYLNKESKVFLLADRSDYKRPQATPQPSSPTLTEDKKVEVCRKKMERQNLPAGRNNFVHAFACEMARHGVDLQRALSECLQETEEGFSEEEVKKAVESAYKRRTREFDDPQILKYIQMVEGNETTEAAAVAGQQVEEAEASTTDKPDGGAKKPVDDEKARQVRKFEAALRERWDFRFNAITSMPEIREKGQNSDFIRMDDYQLNSIVRTLRMGGVKLACKSRVAETIESSFAEKVNPITEHFEGLTPDGQDWIQRLCQTVSPVAGMEMFRRFFEKWLVGAVANVFITDRCANHLCFILAGAQGKFKTTWIKNLCPPALSHYYVEEAIDPDNKDHLFLTTSNFIYNVDDYFSEAGKKKINEFKGFITKNVVTARRAYGRYAEELPKICSFIGTANDAQFLHDPTGSRRFVPFEVSDIDINAAQALDMDQVWAQAYRLFREGFQYWLSQEEQKELVEYNEQFEVQSHEYEILVTYLRPPEENETVEAELTNADICEYLKSKLPSVNLSQKKLGEALRKAGFPRYQKMRNNRRAWVYGVLYANDGDLYDGRAPEDRTGGGESAEGDPF